MIDKELLWKKGYSQHITRSWYDFLYPIFGDPRMVNVFKFLEEQHGISNLTPKQQDIFAPFDYFRPEDLKIVVLGHTPQLHVPHYNNGLSYSYRKHEPIPIVTSQLVSCIKFCEKQQLNSGDYFEKYTDLHKLESECAWLIQELDSTDESNQDEVARINDRYYTISCCIDEEKELIDMNWHRSGVHSMFPTEDLAHQGMLMLNMCPTVMVDSASTIFQHENIWNWFTSQVIELISTELENVIFFAFEDKPRNLLEGLVDERKHLILIPEELPGYSLTEKVNEYIKKHRGVKKIIDFSILT